jgi:hypothetical protein
MEMTKSKRRWVLIATGVVILVGLGVLLWLMLMRPSATTTIEAGLGGLTTDEIDRIVITSGLTGEPREIADEATIAELYSKVKDVSLALDPNTEARGGWAYRFDFYVDGHGYARYTIPTGFQSFDGYESYRAVIEARYLPDDHDTMVEIAQHYYESAGEL